MNRTIIRPIIDAGDTLDEDSPTSTRPDLVAELVRLGARYVSTGTDAAFLMSTCNAKAKQVREIAQG